MTSLADLGEIAKRDRPPPMEVEGYRPGRVSHALPTSDQVYLKEGKEAKHRRMIRTLLPGAGAIMGASVAAGLTAKGKAPHKIKTFARYPISTEVPTNKDIFHHALGAGAGAGVGGAAAQRSMYSSDDVRSYNKQTGVRRHPGMWKVRDWQEGDTR